MKCDVVEEDNVLTITPPFNRLDLIIPDDIVDEVGRVMSYDGMEGVLPPKGIEVVPVDKTFYYSELAKNLLVNMGYSETLLYSLVNKGDFDILKPLASDKKALRKNLSVKMEEALVMNGRNKDLLALETIKLCEFGKVFTKEGETMNMVLGVLMGKKKKGTTAESIVTDDFKALCKELNVESSFEVKNGEFGAIIEVNFSELIKDKEAVVDIKGLGFKSLSEDVKYEAFSSYPFVSRDIAVFVPESISSEQVLGAILENAGELCVKHYQFDEYKKEGKVSYAFRLIFQSFEKTLTDDEVNSIMEDIYTEMKSKNWEVR